MARVVCVLCSAGAGGDEGQAYNCHTCEGNRTMRGADPEVVPLFSILTMRFIQVAHYNGGKAWFGYDHKCEQYPRLTVFGRCDRKTRTTKETWRVDGVDQPSLAAALVTLAQEVQP